MLNELQTFESLNKTISSQAEANVAEAKASSSKKKRKGNNNDCKPKKDNLKKEKKSSKALENKKNNDPKQKTPKGKCFHCNVDGHWKRNYPKYLAKLKEKKKGKSDLLVLEACMVEQDKLSWIVDSGSTNHVCSCLQMFESAKQLEQGVMTMRVGSEALV